VIYPTNTQDATQLALTQSSLEQPTLNVDAYHRFLLDRSRRDGHWYSDKPPGLSAVALPAVAVWEVIGHPSAKRPIWTHVAWLWAVRVLTSGVALMTAVLLAGRVAEGLAPGTGAAVALTFALGTMAGPLGAILMDHALSGTLGFAAFVVAAQRRRLAPLAGALAGLAVLCEYTAVVFVAVVGAYVLARYGIRAVLAFCAGGIPTALLLGAYDLAAFGSPFHLSDAYVAPPFTAVQHQGLFGIHVPSLAHLATELLSTRGGLLVVSPVLLVAVVGLVGVARRGLAAEGIASLAVVVAFLLVDAGYYAPFGGVISPGPRYFAPALPFLTLGLAEGFRRWPAVTAALAVVSIVVMRIHAFTWSGLAGFEPLPNLSTIWSLLGLPAIAALALIVVPVAFALAVIAASLGAKAVSDTAVAVSDT
jgi:hypothetical protein